VLSWLILEYIKQGVALTGRNRTGPPCSVGRPTAHAPGCRLADRPRAPRPAGLTAGSVPRPRSHAPGNRPAGTPAALQTTTTDASQQNNTGPLGGPVITLGSTSVMSQKMSTDRGRVDCVEQFTGRQWGQWRRCGWRPTATVAKRLTLFVLVVHGRFVDVVVDVVNVVVDRHVAVQRLRRLQVGQQSVWTIHRTAMCRSTAI